MAVFSLDLGRNALGSAVDNAAVLDKAFDHPVACTRAVNTCVNASRAKIIISTIANAAMEVLIFHRVVAVVAIYHPGGANIVRLGTEGKVSVVGRIREIVKEA